jgi:hypothetical protein
VLAESVDGEARENPERVSGGSGKAVLRIASNAGFTPYSWAVVQKILLGGCAKDSWVTRIYKKTNSDSFTSLCRSLEYRFSKGSCSMRMALPAPPSLPNE